MQRYTLDLNEFYSDHRQKIFVCRRNTWKHVSCLLGHVRNAFQLPKVCLINQDDVLFPDSEDLDVILETDQIKVRRLSNSLNGSPTPLKSSIVETRVCKQNGTAKRKLESSVGSSSESDTDDRLPKIFAGLENLTKTDETKNEELPKPKRKRIRKRKSKKKDEDVTPPKVIVKTYGKNKIPTIISNDGGETKHIRFSDDDAIKEDEIIEESYRNLNKNVVPRIVKASLQFSHTVFNNDAPAVPEYEDTPVVELEDVIGTNQRKTRYRPPPTSLEIKQELISANMNDHQSLPITTERVDHAKETFLANYSGLEFWNSLQNVLENFPTIEIPNENDIIACRYRDDDYLTFVERVSDGVDDASPALKLTMRRLNVDNDKRTFVVALDQLTKMRLVATYQG